MKDKLARALAIIGLIFMILFIAALVATLIDYKMLNGAVGYSAICLGVFVLIIFLALRADGRGFSMTKINNDIEMEKIEKALEEQEKKEQEQKEKEESKEAETETVEETKEENKEK